VSPSKPNEVKEENPTKILDLKRVDDIGKKKPQTNKKAVSKAKPNDK
jgi:hypothetical protein